MIMIMIIIIINVHRFVYVNVILSNMTIALIMLLLDEKAAETRFSGRWIPLRGASGKIGRVQRRLAWPPRKDDTHKSRVVNNFKRHVQHSARVGCSWCGGRSEAFWRLAPPSTYSLGPDVWEQACFGKGRVSGRKS